MMMILKVLGLTSIIVLIGYLIILLHGICTWRDDNFDEDWKDWKQ